MSTKKTREIALIQFHSKHICGPDYYDTEVMLLDKIHDWVEVTEEEFHALVHFSTMQVIEKKDKPDTVKEELARCQKLYKVMQAEEKKKEEARKKRAAKNKEKSLEKKRKQLEKLKKELGED